MFGLGTPAASNTKIFYANTSVDMRGLQAWHKPSNCSVVSMLVVGGGGGGGGGSGGTGGTGAAAGGGGAASSIATLTIPALFLPNTLYIQVGSGGLPGTGSSGGVAAQSGTSGINSIILSTPTTSSLPNIILAANSVQPGGGQGSQASAQGAAGAAPTLYPTTNNLYVPWGYYNGIVGQAGALGNASVVTWASNTLSGAAGGVATVAVNVTAAALTDLGTAGYFNTTIIGGSSAAVTTNGGGGLKKITPFFNTGGNGGGYSSAITGNGGNGGKGGYGCGGGGGSRGGAQGGLGGNGGNGGDGIVIISWI